MESVQWTLDPLGLGIRSNWMIEFLLYVLGFGDLAEAVRPLRSQVHNAQCAGY